MTLNEIVIKYLKDNGFDGLCGDECGCQISELFVCEAPDMDICQPGYRIKCPGDKCPDSDGCPAPNSGQWCMTTTKPDQKDLDNPNKE